MNERLFIARKRRGLTQIALGKKAGLIAKQIALIENKGWIPPKDVQQSLSKAVGVPVSELFSQTA